MKSARVLFALSVGAVGAALAAACGSSSTGPGAGGSSGGTSSSSSGGSSGGMPSSGSSGGMPSSGSSGGSQGGSSSASNPPGGGVGISCGPSLTCGAPLTFCCSLGSGNGGVTDASEVDAALEGSIANDAGGGPETSGRGDANGADVSGGDDSSAAGASYHCTSSADTCAAGSIILGCASGQNCSTTEACCGTFPDAGFIAQCEPAPCSSGIQLCLSNADCRTGDICALNTSSAVKYGTCVPAEAGPGDGSQATEGSPGGG